METAGYPFVELGGIQRRSGFASVDKGFRTDGDPEKATGKATPVKNGDFSVSEAAILARPGGMPRSDMTTDLYAWPRGGP